MKKCPVCRKDYTDQVQFCTKDGTKLIDLPASDSPAAAHCFICNKYYPATNSNCPVHGIALQLINTMRDELIVETPSVSQSLSYSQEVAESSLSKSESAARTQEIKPEVAAITGAALTQAAIVGYAGKDRKLVTTLAATMIILISMFGVYSFTKPSKQQGTDSTEVSQIEDVELAQEISEETEIQVIPDPDTSSKKVTSSRTAKVDNKNSNNNKDDKEVVEPNLSKKEDLGNSTTGQAKTSKTVDPSVTSSRTTASVSSKTTSSSTPTQTTDQNFPSKKTSQPTTASISNTPNNSSSSTISSNIPSSGTDNTNMSEPKAKPVRHTTSKVVASVKNRSRIQISNGYIYKFDLILQETGGFPIRWQKLNADKVSFSGRRVPVGSFVDSSRPSSYARYRIEIRMTGRSIEDWFGQFYAQGYGVDEDGNRVDINYEVVLDDSFPVISTETSRYCRD